MKASPASIELLEIMLDTLKGDISPNRAKAVAMALRGIATQVEAASEKEGGQ